MTRRFLLFLVAVVLIWSGESRADLDCSAAAAGCASQQKVGVCTSVQCVVEWLTHTNGRYGCQTYYMSSGVKLVLNAGYCSTQCPAPLLYNPEKGQCTLAYCDAHKGSPVSDSDTAATSQECYDKSNASLESGGCKLTTSQPTGTSYPHESMPMFYMPRTKQCFYTQYHSGDTASAGTSDTAPPGYESGSAEESSAKAAQQSAANGSRDAAAASAASAETNKASAAKSATDANTYATAAESAATRAQQASPDSPAAQSAASSSVAARGYSTTAAAQSANAVTWADSASQAATSAAGYASRVGSAVTSTGAASYAGQAASSADDAASAARGAYDAARAAYDAARAAYGASGAAQDSAGDADGSGTCDSATGQCGTCDPTKEQCGTCDPTKEQCGTCDPTKEQCGTCDPTKEQCGSAPADPGDLWTPKTATFCDGKPNTLGLPTYCDDPSLSEMFATFNTGIRASPFVSEIEGISRCIPSSASGCPFDLSFEILDTSVSMSSICPVYFQIMPWVKAFFVICWCLVAVRIVLSA